jgi:sugar/nucleoside kinase (ribokinase family)
MSHADIEVVHVGSASRDVTPDDPRGWRLGGGVTYAALASARLGLRAGAIIGLDRDARAATELDTLRRAGVELLPVDLPEGPVFRNVETPTGRVQTSLRTGVPLAPPPIPASWLRAAAWSLVPVAGELDERWVSVVPDDAFVTVGWQGLLRRLVEGAEVARVPPSDHPLIRHADLVGVSHHDVDPATPLTRLVDLLKPDARLLVTQGQHGGLLVTRQAAGLEPRVLRYLPTGTNREVDPTGAGDTFLAALAAAMIRPSLLGPGRRGPGSALRFAAAAGSLVVEGPGLDGVPDRTAVLVRRARERVRRTVLPSLAAQVGAIDPSVLRYERPPGR